MASATRVLTLSSAWTPIARAAGRNVTVMIDSYGAIETFVGYGDAPPSSASGYTSTGEATVSARGSEIVFARGAGVQVAATALAAGPGLETAVVMRGQAAQVVQQAVNTSAAALGPALADTIRSEVAADANRAEAAAEALSSITNTMRSIGTADVTNTAGAVNLTAGQHGSAIAITRPSRLRRIRFHRTSAGNHSTRIMTRSAGGEMSLRQAVTINSLAAGYHDIEVNVDLLPGDYLVGLAIGHLGRDGTAWTGGMYWSGSATMPFTDTDSTDAPTAPLLIEWVVETIGELSNLREVTDIAAAQEVPQPWSAQLAVDAALVPDNLFGRGLDVAWSDNWRQFGSPFQTQRKAPANIAGKTPRLDLIGMITGQTLDLPVGVATEVYAGRGRTFVGAGIAAGSNRVLLAANQWATFTVGRSGAIHVDQHGHSLAFSTITAPTPSETFICGGQSHMNLAFDLGFIGGFADGIRAGSWVQGVLDPAPHFVNTAIGATGIFKSNMPTGSDKFWVNDDDPVNLTPGPSLLAARDRIAANEAAGMPAPTIGLWSQGDANVLSMNFDLKTHAQLVAGILYVLDDYRARCPGVNFFVSTHPYEDLMPQHKGAIAVRRAYLEAIAARAWLHLGPETYDMPQAFVQTHSNEAGHYRWGYRFAKHYANHVAGQTNDLGPMPSGFAINAERTQITVTMDRPFSATRLLRQILIPQPDMQRSRYRGPMPLGMAVVDASNGNLVPMAYATISGSTATLVSAAPMPAQVRVNSPAGTGGFSGRYAGRIISLDQHPMSPGLPLRSFTSEAL